MCKLCQVSIITESEFNKFFCLLVIMNIDGKHDVVVNVCVSSFVFMNFESLYVFIFLYQFQSPAVRNLNNYQFQFPTVHNLNKML